MKKQSHNPTQMIKSKFSNAVHRILEPNLNMKRSQRWLKQKPLTDAQKVEMFDQIMALHEECSKELTNYQYDRREKKRVRKLREAKKENQMAH